MGQLNLMKVITVLGLLLTATGHAQYREVARVDRLARPMNLDARCSYRVRIQFGGNMMRYYYVDSMSGNSPWVNSLQVSLSYLNVIDIRDYGSALFPAPYSAPDPSTPYAKGFAIDNSISRFYMYEANGGIPLNMTIAFLEMDCGSSSSSSSSSQGSYPK